MIFLSQESISTGLKYLGVMFGGNGNLADSSAAYLLKYYIVILLIAVYASTDLFRNTTARIKDMRFGKIISVVTPVAVTALLIICTALMSYSGQSDTMIIRL
jgi:alginate O-acetyltransferase complex protein AlgI